MRTSPVIVAVVAALALPSCGEAPADRMPTRVVCHSGGRLVLDDFARRGAGFGNAGIYYTSRVTGARTRVTGDCAAFADEVPPGWKPTYPRPAAR